MKLRYKYRIYPTPEQQHLLAKTFGCVRVVHNDALTYCQEQYKQGNKKPSESDLQKMFITQAKATEEKCWLSEVSSTALQQSIADLGKDVNDRKNAIATLNRATLNRLWLIFGVEGLTPYLQSIASVIHSPCYIN